MNERPKSFHDVGPAQFRCAACRHDRHEDCIGGRCGCDDEDCRGPQPEPEVDTLATIDPEPANPHIAHARVSHDVLRVVPSAPSQPLDMPPPGTLARSVIDELVNGGPVLDSAGRTLGVLCARLKQDVDRHVLSQVLVRLTDLGWIVRDIRGKRCFSISLSVAALATVSSPDAPDDPPPAIDDDVEAALAPVVALVRDLRDDLPPEYGRPDLRPRRFVLERHEDETGVSGTGIVAWGVQFPDGVCVTRWCVTEIRQTCVWDSVAHVDAIHGHNGKTTVRWVDL